MKRVSFMLFLLLTMLFGSFEPGTAQIRGSKFGVGILAGGSKLRGDIEATSTSFTSGLILRYSPLSFFAFSLSGTYGNLNSGLNSIKTNILSTGLSGTFFIFPKSRLRPFVSAGVSNFRYTVKDNQGVLLSAPNDGLLGGWRQALQIGAGIELFISQNLALNTVGDYLISPVDDLDGVVEGTKDGYMRGLFGLVLYLGNNSKKAERTGNWQHKLGATFEQVRETGSEEDREIKRRNNITKDQLFAEGISFEPGGTSIQEKSRWQLVRIYRFLKTNPEEILELKPLRGSNITDETVRQFVLARAKSVRKYLVDLGVAPDRITVSEN